MSRHKASKKKMTPAAWNRKLSIPISMPQSLLTEIDSLRGDIPRSVFVCKILRDDVKVGRGGEC
jgi:hypothetical protein